jgi:hypothetical protein
MADDLTHGLDADCEVAHAEVKKLGRKERVHLEGDKLNISPTLYRRSGSEDLAYNAPDHPKAAGQFRHRVLQRMIG